MSMRDYQEEVERWVKQFNPPYWPALEQFAHLAEEVGEVGRELNNIHGIKKKRADQEGKGLEGELFDVLFTVVCIANSHGINLDEAWQRMMKDKMYGRDANRFEKKS